MPFEKHEWTSQKAGVKAFLEAICCPCIKPLMVVGNSMTNSRVSVSEFRYCISLFTTCSPFTLSITVVLKGLLQMCWMLHRQKSILTLSVYAMKKLIYATKEFCRGFFVMQQDFSSVAATLITSFNIWQLLYIHGYAYNYWMYLYK